ncbi:hypothetical protein CsatB_000894 [Cannabis sativa]
MTPNSRRHGLIGTNGLLGFPFHFSSMTILALRSKLQKKKAPFSYRYGEKDLPGVDIFVCTADPKAEPPLMVVNTVLSVMAYDYPPHKLSVYLSDDGASELTFYALLEASEFSKKWLPFCNKFKVEPRSLEAYFTNNEASQPLDDHHGQWASIKIRVSAQISNAPIILNVDCDMYSNYSESVRDAMYFFLDKEKGHEIAYVQFPQAFENLTENDIYSSSLRPIMELMEGLAILAPGAFIEGNLCLVRNTTRQVIKYTRMEKKE